MKNEKSIICTICPKSCKIKVVFDENKNIISTVGHKCKRGLKYANSEAIDPVRTLTTTVLLEDGVCPVVSVKTNTPIPKHKMSGCMKLINKSKIKAPVYIGDIVIKNILGTGVDIVITRNVGENIV